MANRSSPRDGRQGCITSRLWTAPYRYKLFRNDSKVSRRIHRRKSSGYYFKKGILEVFPAIQQVLPTSEDLPAAFYEGVRNGLYHVGMTKVNIMLTDDIPTSLGFDPTTGQMFISPDKLVGDLQAHFAKYASELRNPDNSQLRKNFEARFDADNNLTNSSR